MELIYHIIGLCPDTQAHFDLLDLIATWDSVMNFISRFFTLGENPSLFSLLFALVFVMAACALTGFLIEFLAYRPLRKAPRINALITSVGVSLFLEFTGQLVFGSDPKFFPQIFVIQGQWAIGDLVFNPLQITVFVISLILMAILQFVIFKTR